MEPVNKQAIPALQNKIVKTLNVTISSRGEIKVKLTGEIWTRKDLERVYGSALKELPRYYKEVKEKQEK